MIRSTTHVTSATGPYDEDSVTGICLPSRTRCKFFRFHGKIRVRVLLPNGGAIHLRNTQGNQNSFIRCRDRLRLVAVLNGMDLPAQQKIRGHSKCISNKSQLWGRWEFEPFESGDHGDRHASPSCQLLDGESPESPNQLDPPVDDPDGCAVPPGGCLGKPCEMVLTDA